MYYTSRKKDVRKHVHIEGKGRNLVVRDDKETRERGNKGEDTGTTGKRFAFCQ